MKRFLLSAAALALTSTMAMAADIPMEPAAEVAPVPEGYDWSGIYAGGFVGYGWGEVDVTDEDGYGDGSRFDFDYDADGWYAGSLLGYNRQMGNFVLGIEAEVGHLSIDDEEQDPRTDFDGEGIASIDTDFFGNLSGRVGLAWDRWMVYAKGGLAVADVSVRIDDSNADGTDTIVDGNDHDDWLFGWTVGGGVEVGVWQGWTVRGEYMFADLGDTSQTVTADTNDDGEGDTDFEFNHDLDHIHTVKLGITHKF